MRASAGNGLLLQITAFIRLAEYQLSRKVCSASSTRLPGLSLSVSRLPPEKWAAG